MRLITKFELAAKTENELRGLLRTAFNELASSQKYSMQRRNSLANIENLQCELGGRR